TLRGLLDAFSRGRVAGVAELVARDVPPGKTGLEHLGDRTRRIVPDLTARLVRERSPEVDVVLKQMHARGGLPLEQLPPDLQAWVHAERQAELLVQRPDMVLRPLEGQIEAARFQEQMAMLERACTSLASRGEARALSIVLAWLRRLSG